MLTTKSFSREMVDATSFKAMVAMGYAVSTIGATDLRSGIEYPLARIAEGGLPYVTANVRDEATGELLFDPYTIVERAGVRFAITGVLDPAASIRMDRGVESTGATIDDPVGALEALLPEMAAKSDFVIVLSHLGIAKSKELPRQVEGIDFLVVGNHSSYAARPYEIGSTVFIQPGYRGQYLSDYRLKFDENGAYLGYTGETFALGDDMPGDASIALMLKEHKEAVEAISKERAALDARERAQAQAQAEHATYEPACLGFSDSCMRCHEAEYKSWVQTAHAEAFDTLVEANQSTNPECLKCHTTCQLDLPQDGTAQVPEALRGVQCESCHGIGTSHARDGSYGTVSVTSCLACHDKENSPEFDYATYLPKVKH